MHIFETELLSTSTTAHKESTEEKGKADGNKHQTKNTIGKGIFVSKNWQLASKDA